MTAQKHEEREEIIATLQEAKKVIRESMADDGVRMDFADTNCIQRIDRVIAALTGARS